MIQSYILHLEQVSSNSFINGFSTFLFTIFPLITAGFLTRDPRVVERKKTGKRKARREFVSFHSSLTYIPLLKLNNPSPTDSSGSSVKLSISLYRSNKIFLFATILSPFLCYKALICVVITRNVLITAARCDGQHAPHSSSVIFS